MVIICFALFQDVDLQTLSSFHDGYFSDVLAYLSRVYLRTSLWGSHPVSFLLEGREWALLCAELSPTLTLSTMQQKSLCPWHEPRYLRTVDYGTRKYFDL